MLNRLIEIAKILPVIITAIGAIQKSVNETLRKIMPTVKERTLTIISLFIYAAMVVASVFLLASCQNIPYRSDIGFINSAQANVQEYPIWVQGKICKDMDGRIGACLKQIPSDQDLVVKFDARPYSYRLDIVCSSKIDSDLSQDIEKNRAFEFKIPHAKFEAERQFTCKGEVFPYDRDQEVSASWHLRVIVYDSQYKAREAAYGSKKVIVVGSHALHTRACRPGGCQTYHKKTAIPYAAQGYSESEIMRFNYWGF